MATCIESINETPIGSIQELQPSTVTPFSISTAANKLFKFTIEGNTAGRFNVNLTPQVGSTIRATIAIYRIDAGGPVLIGSVNLSDPNTIFSRDFSPATYVMCIRATLNSYTGNIVSTYVNFPITQRLQPQMFHGQSMVIDELVVEAPEDPCDEPIFFEVIEGDMPPGIDLTLDGILEGQLPNLDCIEDTAELPPSVNWLFVDEDGYKPWGFRWRFKVRAYLANFPVVYVDEWFCIQVHNNWDFDRDNFLEQAPFDRVRTIEIIEEPKRLPAQVCFEPHESDPDTVAFVPQKIEPVIKCEPCEKNTNTQVVLVPIPPIFRERPVSELARWYAEHRDTVFENDELNRFANSLKETDAWKAFIEQQGIDGSDTTTDGRDITVSTNNGNLEIFITSGIDDSHFDVILEKLRTLQNQKIPMTLHGYHGESMSVELGTKIQ